MAEVSETLRELFSGIVIRNDPGDGVFDGILIEPRLGRAGKRRAAAAVAQPHADP